MKIFYGILLWIGLMIYGYLIGSIPFAVIISKSCKHLDIRDYGSHNAGGTNVGRVLGKKYGALVISLDILKTAFGIWSAILFIRYSGVMEYCLFSMPEFYYYPIALFISIGHCLPIFSNFRGGKAVSTFFGTLLSFSPILTIMTLIVFLIILKSKKYVSLASMLSSFIGSFFTLLVLIPKLHPILLYPTLEGSYILFIVSFLSSLFLIFRHKDNILRLQNGNESKIKWMK